MTQLADYRPASDDALDALVGLGSALDETPAMTRAVVLPLMVTTATIADFTAAWASSSLHLSQHLFTRALSALGRR